MALSARERQRQTTWVDPRLWPALVWSLGGHGLVVVVALLAAWLAPAPKPFDLPLGAMVDVIAPAGDSSVMKVGPLARKGASKAAPQKKPAPPSPEVKPAQEPKAEAAPPPKPEPKPEPAPKPEVKPEPPPKPEPKPLPKPEPKPEVKPKPEPKPEPKAEVKPAPKQEPKAPPKKEEPAAPAPKPASKPEPAAPAPKPESKPEPPKASSPPASSPPNEPADTGPAGGENPAAGEGSFGVPGGGGGGGGTRSPEFYAYFAYLYELIKSEWVWAGDQDPTLAVAIRFSILPDGRITEARITERSRIALFDESALNAVRATGSLSPPPPGVRSEFADVELVFRAADLAQ